MNTNPIRNELRRVWQPIVDSRAGDWTSEQERYRMWVAARTVAPDSTLTLEQFTIIDQTCMGHVDWFQKLVLRTARTLGAKP